MNVVVLSDIQHEPGKCIRGMLGNRGSRFNARWLLTYFRFSLIK